MGHGKPEFLEVSLWHGSPTLVGTEGEAQGAVLVTADWVSGCLHLVCFSWIKSRKPNGELLGREGICCLSARPL